MTRDVNLTSDNSIAVIDIGSSSIRVSAVQSKGRIIATNRASLSVTTPAPGFVEFDPEDLYQSCHRLLKELLAENPCSGLAITNQRASTVVFDPENSRPVSNGLSWQDIRTAPQCLAFKSKGLSLSPNQSASKIALIMDLFDPQRNRDLKGCTIDSWIAYRLTGNFITDHTNVATTGLVTPDASGYDPTVLEVLNISPENLPQIRPSIGYFGDAKVLDSRIPLLAVLGDQQASMLGQAVTQPGRAKATFGTGAMVNAVTGLLSPTTTTKLPGGTFPIVARSDTSSIIYGIEAIGLQAGSAIDFACRNLALAENPSQLENMACQSPANSSELFVPALSGLATPYWDFGSLGLFVNLGPDSSPSNMANAITKGIAHLGADLVEALENDSGSEYLELAVDGGMTANSQFLQYLADFSQKRLRLSTNIEATTVGAGLAGFIANGTIKEVEEIDQIIEFTQTVTPQSSLHLQEVAKARKLWRRAIELSLNTVPELSSVKF